MHYIYGMDLAESLNFFACWILYPQDGHLRVKTVKKAKNVMYPVLEAMFTDPNKGLFKKYPPSEVWTDYTSEKAFSEFIETHFNPAFANPHSKKYKKWTIVKPVISSQPMNLQMKQNAAQLMQPDETGFKVFEWPDPKRTRPETGILIAEAREQTLREAAHSMKSGAGMTKPVFPKPTGYDNDLIRALELALMGGRKLAEKGGNHPGNLVVKGARVNVPKEPDPKEKWNNKVAGHMRGFNVTNIDTELSIE